MGCDIFYYAEMMSYLAFQSTHPRGVRQHMIDQILCLQDISIHAPTWGATHLTIRLTYSSNISIHAPTWGATHYNQGAQCDWRFQSTHPRGVRQKSLSQAIKAFIFQSTHPRGVRRKTAEEYEYLINFNPRTHVGCDEFTAALSLVLIISIHAPTWGATFLHSQHLPHGTYFNPRTHVGCDV